MQDIHAIGGGVAAAAGGGGAVGAGVAAGSGGRLFAGGSGGGDRRLRPHHNQNQQALKCPRCDSLNTKFCYYNNYNLSQPRHFCKSCRRYWTKGGVLRNVPVGGGCRKTKRSKPKQQSVSSSDGGGATTSTTVAPVRERNSNSHSSSESSSLTATTTAAKNTATATGSSGEVASATVNSSNTPTNLINFPDSRFFMPQINTSSGFDQQQQQQPAMIDPSGTSNGHIFHDIGTFTNLMTSSNDGNFLGFNMAADISTTTTATAYRLQQQQEDHHHHHHAVEDQCSNPMVGSTGEDEMKMEPINCGFIDQTAHIGFSGLHQSNRVSNGGLAGLDWQINGGGGGGGGGGADQSLFDFTGTVDQTYWGHQWTDNDQSLNFPPLV